MVKQQTLLTVLTAHLMGVVTFVLEMEGESRTHACHDAVQLQLPAAPATP